MNWLKIVRCLAKRFNGWTYEIQYGVSAILLCYRVGGRPKPGSIALRIDLKGKIDYGTHLTSPYGHGIRCGANSFYNGDFCLQRQTGLGKLIKHGTKLNGEFFNGVLHGKGEIVYPDGFSWQGDFLQGNPFSDDGIHPMLKECIEKGICTRSLERYQCVQQPCIVFFGNWFC
eukprot:TRINITY_DN15210_c0_g1_i1.p1 TRINITY_DN15210_c0_g1~~TRINITY_DN15210_c0_g1_i1.p1  ORF type:complete len:172 (-),score=15.47 TRINITY_DN15210_c0_g1_i1:29-544(-)